MIPAEERVVELGGVCGSPPLVEAVHVELESKEAYLAHEGGQVGVAEVARQQLTAELRLVNHLKGRPALVPGHGRPVALVLQHLPRTNDEIGD